VCRRGRVETKDPSDLGLDRGLPPQAHKLIDPPSHAVDFVSHMPVAIRPRSIPSRPVCARAVIPGRRRAGRCISSWTLRPGMIYDPAAQATGVLLAGAKYQGDARRRKEAARP
jgi:hypothetical protein